MKLRFKETLEKWAATTGSPVFSKREPHVFFSSDPHFGHSNIAGPELSTWSSGYRNFKSVEEMNLRIIDGFNNLVGQEDVIFLLGDVIFGNKDRLASTINRINCKNIFYVNGNHDKDIKKYEGSLFITVSDTIETTIDKQMFFMSHYAHRVWNQHHKGCIHLYGHSHGTLEHLPWGKSMDVGIDNAYRLFEDYQPFTLEYVLGVMSKRPILQLDHHNQNTN